MRRSCFRRKRFRRRRPHPGTASARQTERALETVRVAKDGRHIPVSVSVSPLKDNGDNIIGASTIVRDVRDIVAARDALIREKELLATTLASIGDAVIVTDAEGRITFVNSEAERLTGWKSAEAARCGVARGFPHHQ